MRSKHFTEMRICTWKFAQFHFKSKCIHTKFELTQQSRRENEQQQQQQKNTAKLMRVSEMRFTDAKQLPQ